MDQAALLFIFLVLVLLLILSFFIFRYALKIRDKKLPEERGKTPIFTENCAAKFYFGTTVADRVPIGRPMVRFSLYDEFLVVSFTRLGGKLIRDEKILLKFDEIEKVELMKKIPMDPQGIAIHYHKRNVSDYMMVWLKDVDKVKKLIESRLQS